jgi:hypothetical protein
LRFAVIGFKVSGEGLRGFGFHCAGKFALNVVEGVQPPSLTLSFGEIPWFDVRGGKQRYNWLD